MSAAFSSIILVATSVLAPGVRQPANTIAS
jgi:hypothetical protein